MRKLATLAASLLLLGGAAQQSEPAILLTGATAQAGLVRGIVPPGTVALDIDGRPVRVAPDRRFIFGFDRDAPPTALLTARLADGRVVRREIAVVRRTWRIQHINLARGTGGPSPEYARIREASSRGSARRGRWAPTAWAGRRTSSGRRAGG